MKGVLSRSFVSILVSPNPNSKYVILFLVSDVHETPESNQNTSHLVKQLSLKISDPGSCVSQQKSIISPSASLRSRPQSFAQKLRSTGKSVKGYVNLNEGVGTPITLSSPSAASLLMEHNIITTQLSSSDKSTNTANNNTNNTSGGGGRCWKTIYHLLDLYANMPDTKTIKHRFSIGTYDISEHYKGNRKYDILVNNEMKSTEDNIDKIDTISTTTTTMTRPYHNNNNKEHTKLIVFGVARIHRTRLLATLSGLKLEAEITSLHSSLTCRKKLIPTTTTMLECSLTGQIGRTMIVLLEGVAPNQQTVVKITIGKSQTLYSSIMKRTIDKNSGLLTIGAVNIDIPQHPVALHGMVTRGSKQLSSTLQELRVTRTSSRFVRNVSVIAAGTGGVTATGVGTTATSNITNASDLKTTTTTSHCNNDDDLLLLPPKQQPSPNHPLKYNYNIINNSNIDNNSPSAHSIGSNINNDNQNGGLLKNNMDDEKSVLLQPLVMQFSVILQVSGVSVVLFQDWQH